MVRGPPNGEEVNVIQNWQRVPFKVLAEQASSGSCGGRSGTALTESSLPLVEGYHVRWTLDFVRKACKSCVLNHHCQHAGLINLLWLVLTSRHLYSF